MKKKLIVIISASVCAVIALTFGILALCGVFSGNEQNELPPLSFTEKRLEMLLENSNQLTLEGLQKDEVVTYTTSDDKVVTVSEDGVITAKGVGSAIIKATTSLERSALTQVNVHDPESYPIPYINVQKTDITLAKGDSYVVNYTYTYQNDTIDGEVAFTSADTSIVTVEGAKVLAVGIGETTVTISGNSAFGKAETIISVTVIGEQIEFTTSISGKDLYVGKQTDLEVYAKEGGDLVEIDNVTFFVENSSVISLDGKVVNPLIGGGTVINATFDYKGQTQNLSIYAYVYGLKNCTVKFVDGSVNHVIQAYCNDVVQLKIENPLGHPELKNKEIKAWYLNGEKLDKTSFLMPDEDVEVIVIYENETDDNFIISFGSGHLINNEQSTAEFVGETYTDSEGNSSLLGGYVKLSSNLGSSLSFYFEEPVLVRGASSVKLRVLIPDSVLLVYFGVATDVKWQEQELNQDFPINNCYTLRYEVTVHRNSAHLSGRVPGLLVDENKWVTIELPLSAFAKIGEKLAGISISTNANNYMLIDSISVNLGLEEIDPIYYDNKLTQAIVSADNGSDEQVDAITTYRQWSLGLTDEQRVSDTHVQNVALINAIINEYYSSDVEEKIANIATVSGVYTLSDYRALTTGGISNDFKSRSYENFNYTQLAEGNVTYTLPKTDYGKYKEVSFGIFAICDAKSWSPYEAGVGTFTINGQQFEVVSADPNPGYYFKAVVKDGVLTISDDSKSGGESVVATIVLSDEIISGTESLVITYVNNCWSKVEITEAYGVVTVEPVV